MVGRAGGRQARSWRWEARTGRLALAEGASLTCCQPRSVWGYWRADMEGVTSERCISEQVSRITSDRQ